MSYFSKLDDPLEESEQEQHQGKPSAGSRFADLGDRIARAFSAADRGKVDRLSLERGEVDPEELVENPEPAVAPRFAVGPFGYNRAAVDEYISDLERVLEELRRERPAPPTSINEEIERLGEQTASILVVAHDQAHETTRRAQEQAHETTRRAEEQAHDTIRRAQEQAERCIADAAANAVQITDRASRKLRELDNETDAVWRERIRLLDDARNTGGALIALAEQATERFPEDTKTVAPDRLEDPEETEPVGLQDTESAASVRFEDTEAMEPVRFQETQPMERLRYEE